MGESRQSGPGTLRLVSLASQPHRLRPNNPTITQTTSHTTPRTPTKHRKPLQFIYTDTPHRYLGSCSLRSSQRSSLQLRDFQYPSQKSSLTSHLSVDHLVDYHRVDHYALIDYRLIDSYFLVYYHLIRPSSLTIELLQQNTCSEIAVDRIQLLQLPPLLIQLIQTRPSLH